MNRVHKLKTLNQYFNDVVSGIKTFEIRKEDDKIFNIGDELELHRYTDEYGYVYLDGDFLVETDENGSDKVSVVVTYKTSYAQNSPYVVLGIKLK